MQRFAFGLLRPQVVIFCLALVNLFWFSRHQSRNSSEPVFIASILVFSSVWLLFERRSLRFTALLCGAVSVSILIFTDYYLWIKHSEGVMLRLEGIERWLQTNRNGAFPVALAVAIFCCAALSFARHMRDSQSRAEFTEALRSFARRVLTNRAGQLLFVAHLVAVVYEFARRPAEAWETDYVYRGNYWWFDSFANRQLYASLYESSLFETIRLLDIPSILFSTLLTPLRILIYPHISLTTVSWIETPVMLAITSAQWFLVGYGLAVLWRWMRGLIFQDK